MVKNHLRTESELIQLGYEESVIEADEDSIFCEICAQSEMWTEATHESHNMELCYDCWSEINE
jgi:hypothetical protein